jgi:hypothetical protein
MSIVEAPGINVDKNTDLSRSPISFFTAYVEFMKVMLGNLFLINAASATALLSLIGKASDPAPGQSAVHVEPLVSNASARYAVTCLAFGAFFAVVSTALLAWQENRNSDLRERGASIGISFGLTGFCFMLMSALAFLFGCGAAIFLR